MKALIQNGFVIGLWDTPFEVHDSLQWVDATGSCEAGGSYLEGVFTAPISLPKPPAPTYQELRAREYPPVADYLDGIAKADDLQVQKYIDECLAVKLKYPKKAKAKKK